MKLCISSSIIASTLLSLASESSGAAFVGTDAGRSGVGYVRSSTHLRFTEWEDADTSSKTSSRGPVDPTKSIQQYISSPEPAASRSNLDGTVLVSGFANDRDRPDQRIFDLLNDEESSFSFDKIVAFVDDVKFARKRLISRSARYSGLLNKLDFVQSEVDSALPTAEQLSGVKSWVAHAGSDLSLVAKIGQLVKGTDVENVSVLLTGVTDRDVYQSEDAVRSLSGGGKTFTVIAVGVESVDVAEGTHPYSVAEFGTKAGKIPAGATFSRDEGTRLVAECLGLECASNKAMTFTEVRDVNATETKLINGLREAGYEWSQEIEHMIEGGANKYDEACKEFEEKHQTAPAEGWMAVAEEKLKKAQEEEEERQAAQEAEWLREREVAMEAERIKVEEGHAEWA